ncbi:MAG: proprotein convertase P-domain-containing protein [Sedimentisphaerales bacterium]|nr:proprotein convertase P-domain-containing protein [Sedimentisphaerales bacterium]
MPARFSKICLLSRLAIIALAVFARPAPAEIKISKDFTDRPIPSQHGETSGKMEDAVIDVAEHILIIDLDIAVTLTHDAFFDLEMTLTSPQGSTILLNPHSNYSFFTTDSTSGIVIAGGTNRFLFDDEAEIAVEEAIEPWGQPFKPADGFQLSVFDGQDAFGQWRLQISDAWPSHVGQLHTVELIVETPEPNSVFLFGLAGLLSRFWKHHKKR